MSLTPLAGLMDLDWVTDDEASEIPSLLESMGFSISSRYIERSALLPDDVAAVVHFDDQRVAVFPVTDGEHLLPQSWLRLLHRCVQWLVLTARADVKIWNMICPIGTLVIHEVASATLLDLPLHTRTRSVAWRAANGRAVVYVKEIREPVLLRRLRITGMDKCL